MTCTLLYKTVSKKRLYDVAYAYFMERLSPIHAITHIDMNTVSMNKPLSDLKDPVLIIPTRIQSTLTYDFLQDRNGLVPTIQYRSA